jgi:hypothetical protein
MDPVRITRQLFDEEIQKIEAELTQKFGDNSEKMFISMLSGLALYNITVRGVELPQVTIDYDVFEDAKV